MKLVTYRSHSSPLDCPQANFARAERAYKKILTNAENLYGNMSGEVGLVLIFIGDFYHQRNDFEMVDYVDRRINAIVDSYFLDSA